MLKLKNIALIGASALAMTAATTVTAQAQPWRGDNRPAYDHGYSRYDHDYSRQVDYRLTPAYLDRLSARISQAERSGVMSHGWADGFQDQLASLRPIAWRAQNGRASGWEIRRLSDTVNRIDAQTNRYAANDRYGYRR